jgi:P27 family predicted phage terminase small subunit
MRAFLEGLWGLRMRKRGPKPKPTAEKILLGNPGRRKLREDEPVPPPAALTPPSILRKNAIPFWDYHAPILASIRLLTAADVYPLARYCNLLARYAELDKYLMTRGPTATMQAKRKRGRKLKDGSREPDEITAVELPIAREYRQIHQTLLAIECHFGLNPSSRTTLRVENIQAPAPAAQPVASPEPKNPMAMNITEWLRAGGPPRERPAALNA